MMVVFLRVWLRSSADGKIRQTNEVFVGNVLHRMPGFAPSHKAAVDHKCIE